MRERQSHSIGPRRKRRDHHWHPTTCTAKKTTAQPVTASRSQPEGLAEGVAIEQGGEHQRLSQVDGQGETADRVQRRENRLSAACLRRQDQGRCIAQGENRGPVGEEQIAGEPRSRPGALRSKHRVPGGDGQNLLQRHRAESEAETPGAHARDRRRVARDVAQEPGSADGEADEEHGEDRQAGLGRRDVLERIRRDGAGVVGGDLGHGPGGVDVRAPGLREVRSGSADLIRSGGPFVGVEADERKDQQERGGEEEKAARGQPADHEEPEPELRVEHQDVAVEEQRMSGSQSKEHGQPTKVGGETGASLCASSARAAARSRTRTARRTESTISTRRRSP